MGGITQKLHSYTAPTEHPSTLDIAWAAGIYEGEGSVSYSKAKYSFTVRVPQKDTWILIRLKALFGGNIGPSGKNSCSVWHLSGARARGFVMTIYVFLSPRRREQIKQRLDLWKN